MKRVDFDVIVDHLAPPMHIIKSKAELATIRKKEIVRTNKVIIILFILYQRK